MAATFASSARNYYAALKPERTYANVMTTAAGFLFASQWHGRWPLFLYTIVGTTLIVMSACAVNNCTDRSIDAKMPRTKKRGTVTGSVAVVNLVALAVASGLAGASILARYVNILTLLIGGIAYLDYVVLYAWSKRTTPHSTLIGTISGAAPIVAGYTAVTGQFDITAAILGLIMVFWQMVHFYAIGIFRRSDYQAGGLPIWPVARSIKSTKRWMLAYTILYVLSVVALSVFGTAGTVSMAVSGAIGLWWLYRGVRGFHSGKPEAWARQMFGYSLVILLAFSALVSVASILP